MPKLILLLCFFPVIASILARVFFYERISRRFGDLDFGIEAREIAARVLKRGGAHKAEIIEKRMPMLSLKADRLVLDKKIAGSKKGRDLAEAALQASLVLMANRESRVVQWRVSAVKFGWLFPAFSILVLIFAMIGKSLTIWWGVALIAFACALSSVSLWFTLRIERDAARTAAKLLEETAILPRRSEGETLGLLCRAVAWRRIVPGILQWIGKP